jgi:apolipoprotein N-acyltransferase
MDYLQDVMNAERRPATEAEIFRRAQRRNFAISGCIGLGLLVAGFGWLVLPDRDAAPGVWALGLGFVTLMVAAFFGLRAVVGRGHG